jgi:hypothetical protein
MRAQSLPNEIAEQFDLICDSLMQQLEVEERMQET